MNAPISEDAENHAARMVRHTVAKANPGVEGDLESHLYVAYALRQYARHAASDGFGPDHEITRAYLEIATGLAAPIGDGIERRAMLAIEQDATAR